MAERNVSVTLKSGKGYDATWIVVTGDTAEEAKRTLADAVNLDYEIADQYSLAEVAVFANESFQGTSNVVVGLGAEPVSAEVAESVIKGSEEPAGDGWAKAKAKRSGKSQDATAADTPETHAEAPESDEDPILVAISTATSDAALRRIHGRHKGAWTDQHTEAVKARKKELEDG